MSEHKCKEWIKGHCTECDEHYTDYVDSLQAKVDGLHQFRDEMERNYMALLDTELAKVNEYKVMFEGMKKAYESNAARVLVLEAKVDELTAALVKCNQAAISDPHDERDIDVHWLQNVILSTTNSALKQEVKGETED